MAASDQASVTPKSDLALKGASTDGKPKFTFAGQRCGHTQTMGPPLTTPVSIDQLTAWADSLIHMNHLGALVQREIADGDLERAAKLSERSRQRAWVMLNEMFAAGALKPEGYAEPGSSQSDLE